MIFLKAVRGIYHSLLSGSFSIFKALPDFEHFG
jgi:hypothetical protein